jgi:hypothetical protein
VKLRVVGRVGALLGGRRSATVGVAAGLGQSGFGWRAGGDSVSADESYERPEKKIAEGTA